MEKSLDEWLKIAADNKINASNSWNLALIDYFHGLNSLREGDSINFQKASSTLDGCVKIYSSRVDSIDSDTKNLLNGLINNNTYAEVGEGENDETKSRGNTVEKDVALINLKKIDEAFLIDPLFKKTCADFDEGTASGLLLNHLNMTNEGMIIFDASDDVTVSKQMADDLDEECNADNMLVDIATLKTATWEKIQNVKVFDVCPSLKTFDFRSGTHQIPQFNMEELLKIEAPCVESYAEPDDALSDFEMDAPDIDNFQEAPEIPISTIINSQNNANDGAIKYENELLEFANTEENLNPNISEAFSYFDTKVVKQWAGPDHWKPRKTVKPKSEAPSKKRSKKEPVEIDFSTRISDAVLFAKSSVSIYLPPFDDNSAQANLLPQDEHFSAKDFLKLFLKPDLFFSLRKNGCSVNVKKENIHHDEEIQEETLFWSQNQDMEMSLCDVPENEINHDQVFDDDDMDGVDTQVTNVKQEFEYGDVLVAQPKKMHSNYINYAKSQKKVDIKQLKENLWSNIIDLTGEEDPVEVHKENRFSDIVHGLNQKYPNEKLSDISVAYCFICLLHLANEKNLSVVDDASLRDLKIQFKC